MKRFLSLALCLVLLAALLPGCAKKEVDRRETNELVMGIAQDLDSTLDPHLTTTAGTREVLFNVFEGLVKPNADGELLPAVAESWVVSDDLVTYTFTVRSGITFHNGQAVKASDAAWSIARCRDEGLVSGLEGITDISADDEAGTLTLTLSAPDSDFLSRLTLAVLPQDYAQQDSAPVGTGPFRFVSRAAQQNVVLERYDGYWGEKAQLDRVTFRIFENADALVLALKSGALDLVAHLTATQVSQLGDEFTVLEGTMNLVQAVYLNHAYEPLSDVRVRQALCYAIDRDEIFSLTADGRGTALGSSVYPNFRKYFLPELADAYPHDVDRAKQLLAAAGYPDGFDLTITVPNNYQPHIDTAQVVAEQLREAGVNVTLELVEWTAWLSDVYAGRNFQATVTGLDAKTLTASATLERFVSDAGKNFINYQNPDYDAAYAAALSAADDATATAYYKQCETLLSEDAANVYLQDIADLVAVRSGLTGYRFYPIYVVDLSGVHYE